VDAKGYHHWQEITEDMRRSGLKEYEYCLREGLDRRWLEDLRREAAMYECAQAASRKMFVELEVEEPQKRQAARYMNVNCQDVVFELEADFDAETFKRALRAVREAS
jgi:hypothetical protein